MVRFIDRSRGGPAQQEPSSRPRSFALTLLGALAILSGSAHAQFPGMAEHTRIGFVGPDGQMQYLPTAEEMAEAASRGTDISAFADYAQRRLELASMISEIVYVDDDAPVGGDGTSWQTAHQSLQDALAQDYSDRLVEIRMAQGNYRPDRFNGANTHDPEATFAPRYEDGDEPTGIFRITGGYAGLGATDPDQQDPELFPTVITGDLNGDDGPDFTNYADNSLVLFNAFNSELHGLVMEHARQAMFVDHFHERLTIDDCTVQRCSGMDRFGAVQIYGELAVLKRNTFFDNRSEVFGGAVTVATRHLAVAGNRFLSNSGAHGGGLLATSDISTLETAALQNNYFAGNQAYGPEGSIGGAAAIYSLEIVSACNTTVFNRSLDGPGGGYGQYDGNRYSQYTVFDLYHMNEGHTGRGLSEQFPSLSYFNSSGGSSGPAVHQIRGSFVQDWESSESNRPGSHASTLDSIRGNSGEEVLFVDLAGPDGIIGTLDDDPTPRPDSPNIDRIVDLEGAERALFDYADLNENGVVDEPLPFDLLGNPRSIDTPGIGSGGGIDAGAIEYAGDPNGFDYDRPISGRRVDPMDGCEGDEPIRLYVNAGSPVSGDGSSWDSPLLELHEALDIARHRCGPVEIWLAAGTYLPDFSVPLWRASFRPTSNVTILGGFAGDESAADERDPVANPTVLSGDQFGNDKKGDLESMADNAYRVVVATGERGGGVLDGLTITGGHAAADTFAGFYGSYQTFCGTSSPLSQGAGITVLSGSVTLRNCTIEHCAGQNSVAVAASGTGDINLQSSEVSGGLIRVIPSCALPSEYPASAISGTGIDSILVRPIEFTLTDMTLVTSESVIPFGWFTGNTNLTIDRSTIDASLYLSGPVLHPVPGDIQVQSFRATSSLIRNTGSIRSANTDIGNCTVFGDQHLVLLYIPRAPEQISLQISNSVVAQYTLSGGPMIEVSQIRNSTCLATNFVTQTNTITLPSHDHFEPYFLDYFGPDGEPYTGDEDLRLAPGSPAINTGLNAFVTSDFDLDGNERIIGSVVDRGAYEFTGTCTGDVNGDGEVNLGDLNLVLANFGQDLPFGDASGDGSVTMTDLNLVLAAFGHSCK